MTTKVNLAKIAREKDAGAGWYMDDKERGLYLHIGKDSRAYYLIKKVNGKSEKYKIGDAFAMPATIAREEAAKMKADIVRGITPKIKAAEEKRKITFGEYATMFVAKAELAERTRIVYRSELRKYLLPRFGGKRMDEITKQEVAEMFYSIEGATAANNVVNLLRNIIERAISDGFVDEIVNPCARIKLHKKRRRERRFTAEELRKIIETIEESREYYTPIHNICADIVLMALYTGQRKNNVMTIEWSEVDTERRLWTIPASKAKNKRRTVVYLNDAAMMVLARREKTDGAVFGKVANATLFKFWVALMKQCNITGAVFHTLRHTHASMLADMGASTAIIGKALGHANLSSTAIYTHPDAEAVRAAEDKLAAEFFKQ